MHDFQCMNTGSYVEVRKIQVPAFSVSYIIIIGVTNWKNEDPKFFILTLIRPDQE